ncbi:MAG TPA: hypothetical protein PLQ34_09805, partial [Ferrovaceae bacterium]|nr:hypothetical protein [Ferrovaceae bacterium]
TGKLISGKMSLGVLIMEITPNKKITNAMTINVLGRLRANLTISSIFSGFQTLINKTEFLVF